MDKINAMVEVDTSVGETPVDVTCPWEGANFVLKVKQVGGFSNYDESKFAKQTAIPKIDDEAFQVALDADMFDLATIASPDQFKPLDKLTEEFKAVLGTSASGGAAATAAKQADALADELDNFESQMDQFNAAPAQTEPKPAATDSLDDLLDDIQLGYFSKRQLLSSQSLLKIFSKNSLLLSFSGNRPERTIQ